MIEAFWNDPIWRALFVVILSMGGVMLYALPKAWRDDRRLAPVKRKRHGASRSR